jgi:glycosyltransferase involved in cell wall biosynthesis
LRLLTVTHYFPSHGGGIELVARELVEQFCAQGVEVEWVASDCDPPPEVGARRIVTPVPASNWVERLTQLPYPIWGCRAIGTLNRAIGRADVIHVHEHLYMGSLLCVLIAAWHRRPVVITQHMGALRLSSWLSTRIFQGLSRTLGRAVFAAGPRVVFISDNVRRFFGLADSSKAQLVFNGVELGLFRSIPTAEISAARAALDFGIDRQIVLFVGRFVRKKGIHIIRALAAQFPDVLFVFAGAGPEDPSNWGRENVRVVGRLSREQLPPYYQVADVLLLPSAGEGFPLVVQEALACGLGVLSTQEVATACPDARVLIRVPSATSVTTAETDWAGALRHVLGDHAYLDERESRAARARALWSWPSAAVQYLQLFRQISSESASG